ncbi:LutC/YkgG family protein [Caldimonas brevitalea]|uniref:L-lactate dehydrogenase complex protein LldG n=1 Tax=Caldimonas brevitalea TaxID=413882 RepID=A0A0G3BGR0_9BURK|nr:LUD domain-containing protein [Caldimonas brevitalea]AKJ27178.1 L-lactate dehydrogenase complex protein LldG [Caldimonas brevitalea]
MKDTRSLVLNNIRAALGRGELTGSAAARVGVRSAPPRSVPTPAGTAEVVEQFVARATALSMTLERVACRDDVPGAVAAYLAARRLAPHIVVAAPLAPCEWPASLTVRVGPARQHDAVGVTPCFAAIAETGSLVLLSSAGTPTSLNFVPDDHIVVLGRAQIVARQEEVWTRLRSKPMPRAVNIVSGPSRTADVEQVVQLGVHGPRRVHVVLVEQGVG